MQKKKRVLLLSVSAGAGHTRAAQALEKVFLTESWVEEVQHVDVLEYTNKVFRYLYSKAYLEMVNAMPEMLGWLYDHLDTPWKHEKRRLLFDKLNTRPFVKYLKAFNPDVVVCTHFLPSEIISWLYEKGEVRFPQAIVVTDFDVHAMWLSRYHAHYFVALEETKVHLEALGIDKGKITISGIPIDPVFAEKKDQSLMRKAHGLQEHLPTLLVSAGGFGVGPLEHLLRSLGQLRTKVQVLALCGKNEELRQKVQELGKELQRSHPICIHPLGYTTKMDELMSAADLVVGKPGGLTTSEALAKGLVYVVVSPIPGQEERNADHLLEQGCAIRGNNLPTLAYKIDTLLGDPLKIKQMRENVTRLARPFAASTIVKTVEHLK